MNVINLSKERSIATSIERNIQDVQRRIARAAQRAGRSPDEVTILGATKLVLASAIQAAFHFGISNFGENRVQEAKPKIEQLSTLEPRPIWHMIGHLQTNKVKTAVKIFDIIHSVDSLRLAEIISRRANHPLPVLLQVNVAGEASKSGFTVAEVIGTIKQIERLPNLEIKGLMTIAPLVDDPEEVRPIFRQLRQLRDSLGLEHLSMGMTDDFEVAVEEGATMVRIGRAIFGERKPG